MFNGYGLFALSLTSTLTASANFANPVSVLQSVTWVQYQRLSDIFFLFTIQKSKALGDLLQQIAESGRNLRDKSRHTSSPTSKCSDSQSSPPWLNCSSTTPMALAWRSPRWQRQQTWEGAGEWGIRGEGVEWTKAGPRLFAPVSQCRINIKKDLTFIFTVYGPPVLAPIRTGRKKRRWRSTTSLISPAKEQCLSPFPSEHMWRMKGHKTKRVEYRRRKERQSTNQVWFRK